MRDKMVVLGAFLSHAMVVGCLVGISVYIFYRGFSVITVDFLTTYPKGMPLGNEGGVWPAIVGTLFSGVMSAVIAGLLGTCSAIYLHFFCSHSYIAFWGRFISQCLSGIPSITIGLFGYSFFVMNIALGKNLLTASLTLAFMIIPFIFLRVEKLLESFPKEIIEASHNLGVSVPYMVYHLVLPYYRKELATTVALAASYAMGATAPIMFTGAVLFTGTLPSLDDPFMALPYHLYILITGGYSVEMAYGTAAVLLILLVIINGICHIVTSRKGV